MKKLEECKEYYKDVFMTWLSYKDADTEARLNAMKETLSFIYEGFKKVEPRWTQEALNEYYSKAQ